MGDDLTWEKNDGLDGWGENTGNGYGTQEETHWNGWGGESETGQSSRPEHRAGRAGDSRHAARAAAFSKAKLRCSWRPKRMRVNDRSRGRL